MLSLYSNLRAQNDSVGKITTWKAWVKTYDSRLLRAGELIGIGDSSIVLLELQPGRFGFSGKVDKATIDVREIDAIRVRRNGSVGQGVLIGALAGLTVGGVIDLIYYSSWSEKRKETYSNFGDALAHSITNSPGYFAGMATLIGVACIGTGIGIGASVGGAKITIAINGSRDQYDLNKALLKEYTRKSRSGR